MCPGRNNGDATAAAAAAAASGAPSVSQMLALRHADIGLLDDFTSKLGALRL